MKNKIPFLVSSIITGIILFQSTLIAPSNADLSLTTAGTGNVILNDVSIKDNKDFEILAIGIGHDVSRYYKKAIKITDVQELGDVMIKQLSQLFEKKLNKKNYH